MGTDTLKIKINVDKTDLGEAKKKIEHLRKSIKAVKSEATELKAFIDKLKLEINI